MAEASKFIKVKMKTVMRELTRELHLICEQFLSYRKETMDKL